MTEPTDFRADIVGSMIRPEALVEVQRRGLAGDSPREEIEDVQDRAITDVVRRLEALDFPVVGDGEFRRFNFQDVFAVSVSGMDKNPNMMRPPPGWGAGQYAKAAEKLRFVRNVALEEWRFVDGLSAAPAKVTLVSPGQVALRVWPQPAYASTEDLLSDVTALIRRQLTELVQAGCPYIQVDAPSYSEYMDVKRVEERRAQGRDPVAELARDIEADNSAVEGVAGPVVAMHICRGGFFDPRFLRSGSYEPVAEQLFGSLRYRRFLLEFDSERSGGFEPLRFVPDGVEVVLGLVSTKVRGLENPDDIKRRIDEAAKYVPLDRLALSTQCGFSTVLRVMGRPEGALEEEDQWRKLELIRSVAADVWG